jgi:putative transposase
MSQEMNKLFHCVYNLNYHLVLVTKYRRKCINKDILLRLQEIIKDLCKKWDSELIEFNGEPDHIHLLLELNPKIPPSIFVNNIKTVTSRLIRRDFLPYLRKYYWKDPVFWSRSYCILTCGGAPLSVIKQYIDQQAGLN